VAPLTRVAARTGPIAGVGLQVACPVHGRPDGRPGRRAAARGGPHDHRRAGRGAGHPHPHQAGLRAGQPLVDPVDGGPDGAVAIVGLADLAGVRPQAACRPDLETEHGPGVIARVRDVAGLYMSPPEHALVLAVDEKSQIQALDRTAPCLPMLPTTSERRTHDYVRHGTTSLFAAYDLASGSVIAQSYRRAPAPGVPAVPQAHRNCRAQGPGAAPGPGLIPTPG
jgi:hypothetical protein